MKRLMMFGAALLLALGFSQALPATATAASAMAVPALSQSIAGGVSQTGEVIQVRGRHHGRGIAIGIGAAILGAAILSGAARSAPYDYGYSSSCWKERFCRPVEHCWWRHGYEHCRVRRHCRLETVCN